MATSVLPNQFQQHGLQIALSIATHIIVSGMSGFGVSVQRTNLVIISLLMSNTLSGIKTYIESSVIPTPRQPVANYRRAIFSEDSMSFDKFLVS